MSPLTRKKVRSELIKIFPNCIYCGKKLTVNYGNTSIHRDNNFATIEHVIPKEYGGVDDISNFALACGYCNSRRKHIEEILTTGVCSGI